MILQGGPRVHELMCKGDTVEVDADNLLRYLQLYTEKRLVEIVQKPLNVRWEGMFNRNDIRFAGYA